ncbi:MAG TPA: hypothetical protein VHD56_12660 [Tepidisphaeraceae bacterium]|nr:hypothetical protein [Tepidisphaeraceae bacterium]
MNSSFSATPRQARQVIDEMRREPKQLHEPLLIVGGFLDMNLSPPDLADFFSRISSSSKIITVSLGMCTSFEECRRTIIAAADQACPSADPVWTSQVDVVGVSLGGLASRYAAAPSRDINDRRRLKIARLFTISSPHAGATLARHVGFTEFHRDMQPGSEFLKMLAREDGRAGYTLIPYKHLHDEVVGEQFAAPLGVSPWWLDDVFEPSPHLAAVLDERIRADIALRLRDETPLTTSPPEPLPQDTSQ